MVSIAGRHTQQPTVAIVDVPTSPKQCAHTMNTIRSFFTATVAFLVVAIGGRVASSMDNIVVQKCCEMGRLYDPKVRLCRLPGTDVDKYHERLINRLQSGFRVEANDVLNMTYYAPPFCNATQVLVDVPAVEVSGLMEVHPSPIELPPDYCFDLTPSDELVARTCRPRDQYCGRGNYTCVNKCCYDGRILVDDPNNMGWLKCNNSEMRFTLSAYETNAGASPLSPSNNTVLPLYSKLSCPATNKIDKRFILTTDGNLLLIHEGAEWIIPDTEYCLEYYAEDGPQEAADLRAFVCSNVKPPVGFLFWIKTLSVMCLVFTLIVYATLLYLRNPHGYTIRTYI